MFPFTKSLYQLTEIDLTNLINDKVSELKTIEYKSELPGNTDNDKKEFLADVSSFANTSGGYLIYGMKEKKGIAAELIEIKVENVDELKQRLENIIRTGLAPRIPALEIQVIQLTIGGYAIIIQIPKSWFAPHMVTYGNTSRFFARNSSGKYQLDVQQIKQAFLLSEEVSEKIRIFRNNRISQIIARETPVSLPEGAAIILHCIPIMTFESSSQVNIPTASDDIRRLRTIEAEHNLLFRHNLDGIVTYFNTSIGYSSYCQLYRNGILEAVDVSILLEDQEIGKVIRGQYLEHQLAEFCEKNIPLQRELGVNGPIYLFLSLVSVKGYRMVPKQNHYSGHAETKIDRDHLLLPEIMIDERDNVDWYRILHPLFDMLWNATGWPKCMDYDENGTWNPN